MLNAACRVAIVVLMLGCAAAGAARASAAPVAVAHADIPVKDMAAIHALFDRMSSAFEHGDADGCVRLFWGKDQKLGKMLARLKDEFEQTRYRVLEIRQVVPDDTLSDNNFSVDVSLRFKCAGTEETNKETDNTTSHTFVLHRLDDGNFLLVSSTFFDNLGMAQGAGLFLRGGWAMVGAGFALMLAIGLVLFWGWMGIEACVARPRSRSWQGIVVFIPVIGALAYFLLVYRRRKSKTTILVRPA